MKQINQIYSYKEKDDFYFIGNNHINIKIYGNGKALKSPEKTIIPLK